MDWLPVFAIVLIAVAFDYTNGFHDAANAIAALGRSAEPDTALAALVRVLGAATPPAAQRRLARSHPAGPARARLA